MAAGARLTAALARRQRRVAAEAKRASAAVAAHLTREDGREPRRAEAPQSPALGLESSIPAGPLIGQASAPPPSPSRALGRNAVQPYPRARRHPPSTQRSPPA